MFAWGSKLKIKRLGVLCLTGLIIAGCGTTTAGSRDDKLASGVILGATAASLVTYANIDSGNRFLFGYLAGVAGGVAGYYIMDDLTSWDRKEMEGVIYQSLSEGENGSTVHWQSSNSDAQGGVTPLRSFLDSQGRMCRDLQVQTVVDGEKRQKVQTMCRNGAGHWVTI